MDERLRRLEIAAARGDPQARDRLIRDCLRSTAEPCGDWRKETVKLGVKYHHQAPYMKRVAEVLYPNRIFAVRRLIDGGGYGLTHLPSGSLIYSIDKVGKLRAKTIRTVLKRLAERLDVWASVHVDLRSVPESMQWHGYQGKTMDRPTLRAFQAARDDAIEYEWPKAHQPKWIKGRKRAGRWHVPRPNPADFPIQALWGEDREPVLVLGPAWPGQFAYYTARLPWGEEGYVSASELFTLDGYRWRSKKRSKKREDKKAWTNNPDRKMRELERAAARGDQHAQAQLLLMRMRAGQLSMVHLQLAAELGHPAARIALGFDYPAAGGAVHMQHLERAGPRIGIWWACDCVQKFLPFPALDGALVFLGFAREWVRTGQIERGPDGGPVACGDFDHWIYHQVDPGEVSDWIREKLRPSFEWAGSGNVAAAAVEIARNLGYAAVSCCSAAYVASEPRGEWGPYASEWYGYAAAAGAAVRSAAGVVFTPSFYEERWQREHLASLLLSEDPFKRVVFDVR